MAMSGSLEENVLTLLCFSKKHVELISSNVSVDHFTNEVYRDIAEKAVRYYKKYKKPIAGHLPDVFEKQLDKEKSRKKAEVYETVLKGLYELRDEINPEFVLQELEKFVNSQSIRLTLKKAVELYQEGKIDAIDRLLKERENKMMDVFDTGILFGSDMKRTLAFLNTHEEYFTTGIPYLDMLGVVPVRKELLTTVGLPGTGKSWAMVHIGKYNVFARETVVHVTLEMSEDRCAQRYVQSMLAVAKRSYKMHNIDLKLDKYGCVSNMKLYSLPVNELISLQDDGIKSKIKKRMRVIMRPRLIIKQFPTGQLTIDMLVSYLENLRAYAKIIPDILIVDYADLMNIDSKYLRVETGKIYQQLRGLAIQYNMAVITASQANRVGQDVTTLTRKHLAEDFSKVSISDNVITYNQTPLERPLGLARLYIDKARNDKTGDSVLITQNYNMGQFCLQSALMKGNYFDKLEEYFPDIVKENFGKRLAEGRKRLTRMSGKREDE
jgi:replicative DNA helicase